MHRVCGLISGSVACGVCGAIALAQPGDRSQVDIKARVKGTTAWLDILNVSAATNEKVDIEIAVFLYRSTGYGMGGCGCEFVTTNWTPGDTVTLLDRSDSANHPDGRQGNFNFGRQAQAAFTTGRDAGLLRISSVQQDEFPSISMKQNTPPSLGPAFDTTDGILAYRFDITLANTNPGASTSRTVISGRQPGGFFFSYSVYKSPTSTTTTSIMSSRLPNDPATIHVHWTACDSKCGADFDCNGFVSGADFDEFVTAFESGSADADFDGNGFVNGDDFDAYAAAFEAGC